MWLMLQKKTPNDYVIATNKSYTVRKFIQETYKYLGVRIEWKGRGNKEVGIDKQTNKIIIKVNGKYYRPNEVENLRGNPSKAKKDLKSDAEKLHKKGVSKVQNALEYELDLQS